MNPLAAYLEVNPGLTQAEFAARMTRLCGWTVTQPQVSHWCGGQSVPSMANRLGIARATKGAVPVEAWDGIAAEHLERRRAVASSR